jgi:hypothetical protein
MSENRGPYLRTKYVFIDTQTFRKARADWSGRSFSRVTEFAKIGQLCLLVTDVTVREVKSQLGELATEANRSLIRNRGILEQLGASVAIERLRDQTTALSTLGAAFDLFLQRTNAINVPLISDIGGLLDDYFGRRPPFSSKKKSEFPDAISIASVRIWCEQKHVAAYVVSEDPDLRACCSDSGPLFHANSIEELISQATVSRELHGALERALRESDYLRDDLTERIKDIDVDIGRSVSFAKIDDVQSVNITSINVLEQQEHTFTCELEVEADISLEIDVEIESNWDEYASRRHHSIHRSRIEYFYPEVVVRFDPSTEDLEFESIYVSTTHAVRVDLDDEGHLYR